MRFKTKKFNMSYENKMIEVVAEIKEYLYDSETKKGSLEIIFHFEGKYVNYINSDLDNIKSDFPETFMLKSIENAILEFKKEMTKEKYGNNNDYQWIFDEKRIS